MDALTDAILDAWKQTRQALERHQNTTWFDPAVDTWWSREERLELADLLASKGRPAEAESIRHEQRQPVTIEEVRTSGRCDLVWINRNEVPELARSYFRPTANEDVPMRFRDPCWVTRSLGASVRWSS